MFIPQIISEQNREVPWIEWIEGAVLFADVSGFTPMSEELSKLGVEGAEILTDILNRYFSRMIRIIHGYGGQVMKFGGDAILCFFPGKEALHHTIQAAWKMQKAMTRFQNIKTAIRKFSLQMKIGIATGETLLGCVGNPAVRLEYIFAGAPVDLSADAEHHALSGEIILAMAAGESICSEYMTRPISTGFSKIVLVEEQGPFQSRQSGRFSKVKYYLIKEIFEMAASGYDRFIASLHGAVPVFIQFSGFHYTREGFELAAFSDFFTQVITLTHQYKGRLNRLSMGDKGSTFFLLFGAPTPLEEKELLACSWALELKGMIEDYFPNVSLRIGINEGRIYSGIVGGAGRYDYTVMGDAVNFAARLMQKAKDNQILISNAVHAVVSGKFRGTFLGKQKFKGKSQKLPVYLLQSRKKLSTLSVQKKQIQNAFYGREKIVSMIQELTEKVVRGKPAVLITEGEAGVGKTTLCQHIIDLFSIQDWNILLANGNVIDQGRAYEPWQELLRKAFFDDDVPSRRAIENRLAAIDKHSTLYLSLFEDFFGLPVTTTDVYYDQNTRKRLVHHLASSVIVRYLIRSKTIMFLDDLHLYDTLSYELFMVFLNHLRGEPIFILAATRPGWRKELLAERDICSIYDLQGFEQMEVQQMAEGFLGGPVGKKLVLLLFEHARGNPFFTRTLLEHLKGLKLIERRIGIWTVLPGLNLGSVFRGDEIILAKIALCSLEEQVILRYAACAGPTFSRRVLKETLKNRFSEDTWNVLCQKNYFYERENDMVSFHHTLEQQCFYNSLTLRFRKRTHRKFGLVIETMHASNLDSWCSKLADHFLKGHVKEKAVNYCIIAAKQKWKKDLFLESYKLYESAYILLKYTSDPRKLKLEYSLSHTLYRLEKLETALTFAQKSRHHALQAGEQDLYFDSCILQYMIMEKLSLYTFIPAASRLLKRIPEGKTGFSAKIRYCLGLAYFRKGKLERSLTYLENIIEEELLHENEFVLIAYQIIASIYRRQLRFRKALSIIENAIVYAQKWNKPYQELGLQIEKALIILESGDSTKSMQIYSRLLGKCEEYGDLDLLATALVNCGNVEISRGEFRKAQEYIEEAIELFNSFGDRRGLGNGLNLLGFISFEEGDYETSYNYYYRAMESLEQKGDKGEIVLIYYNLAEVSLKSGRKNQARKWLQQFQQMIKISNSTHLQQYHDFLLHEIMAAK